MIMDSSWDGFRTKCWSFVDFVFTLFGHVWDMCGHTFGTLFEICFETDEISKSNETLPDHFSIQNKAFHEVERQIRRFSFFLYFVRTVLLNYVRQPYFG